MVTIDEYSRMVSAVHAAAITPEHWLQAMTLVRQAFDATSSAVIVAEETGRIIKCASLSPDAMQTYKAYYHAVDYVLEAVETSPVGLARGGEELVASNARSEFNADWLRPHGMTDGLFVRLTEGDQPMCFLVAAPLDTDGYPTPDRLAAVNALVPHLQQALRTQAYLTDLVMRTNDIAEAIDGMRHAVIVVGPTSTVLHANSAAVAVLNSHDGLCLADGRLIAGCARADVELRHSVGGALGLDEGGARAGSSFACQRRSGKRPYIVHVSPFTTCEQRIPRALVVILDPDAAREPPATMLRRLFGLTDAEADVALRVSRGLGLRPIADELSLSMATVKTHLQHVFAKTATHRQAELVRLMMSLVP